MNILLTGSSGFVGRNLLSYFESKAIKANSLSLRNNDWLQYFPDNCKAIIHLAGKAHDTKNTNAAEEYFKVNTKLTIELFDSFLQSKTQDFIFFSSVKAVADRVATILEESESPSPQTPYGQSKLEAEKYILAQSLPKGKRVFILRPCMIHGMGNKGNLNLLYNIVKKGIPWPLASFQNQRSFLSIENLEYVIYRLIQDDSISGGIYNIADDDAISTNELIHIIGEVTQSKSIIWNIPTRLIKAIAQTGDLLRLPLNSERLKKLTENYIVDNSKIKAALKIDRLPVSARDGLVKTLKTF